MNRSIEQKSIKVGIGERAMGIPMFKFRDERLPLRFAYVYWQYRRHYLDYVFPGCYWNLSVWWSRSICWHECTSPKSRSYQRNASYPWLFPPFLFAYSRLFSVESTWDLAHEIACRYEEIEVSGSRFTFQFSIRECSSLLFFMILPIVCRYFCCFVGTIDSQSTKM